MLLARSQMQAAGQVACIWVLYRTGAGGAGRDRTDDPLLAKQVLSQLSYSPACQESEVRSQESVAAAIREPRIKRGVALTDP